MQLSETEVDAVLALADEAERADGVYPLSEDAVLRLRRGGPTGFVAYDGDALAGFAYVEDGGGELFVGPRFRRRGHGTALLAAAGDGSLRFWAHGDEPGARAFAEKNGFARARVMWQMRRSLTTEIPAVPLPAGVTIRGFRPGADEQAWLDVNARAFAHHPEQGKWTLEDLREREAEPWFDPAGFLLAVDIEDRLLGFHWTKVHPDDVGEIYVLGVDPDGHRKGLGAALTAEGLRHLAGRGLPTAMLYVDEDNPAAVALYRRFGFEIFKTDINYVRTR